MDHLDYITGRREMLQKKKMQQQRDIHRNIVQPQDLMQIFAKALKLVFQNPGVLKDVIKKVNPFKSTSQVTTAWVNADQLCWATG